jgi:hypothetical protein
MTRDDYDDNPFDEHGLLRDGKRARVPLLMRDSMTPLQRSVAADAARRSGGVVFGDGSDNLACHKPGPRYRADAAADDVRWQAYLDGVKQEAEEWRKKPAADAGSGEFRGQQPSLLRCDQRGLGSQRSAQDDGRRSAADTGRGVLGECAGGGKRMAEAGAMNDRVPPYSLAQCIERMPFKARRKYEDLKALLADSEALQRSLMERIRVKEERLADLMRRRSYASVAGRDGAEVERLDGELAAIRTDLDRLESERSKRNSIRANCEQVKSRIDNFITARASGASEMAAPPRVTNPLPAARRKGESTADALLRVRREIAAAVAELKRIKSAPPPSDEVKIAIIEGVKALANEGRPRVTVDGGRVSLIGPTWCSLRAPVVHSPHRRALPAGWWRGCSGRS